MRARLEVYTLSRNSAPLAWGIVAQGRGDLSGDLRGRRSGEPAALGTVGRLGLEGRRLAEGGGSWRREGGVLGGKWLLLSAARLGLSR